MLENETKRPEYCKKVPSEAHPDGEGYTVDEIRTVLGISETSVMQLVRAEVFQSAYVEGQYWIAKESFDAWLDAMNRDIDECQGHQ